MCASVAFGQANHNLNKTVKVKNLHQANMEDRFVAKDPMTSKPSYFFTKDDTIKVFQFNVAATDPQADYSLGNIIAGDVIDGNPATPHGHSAAFASWKRWVGNDSATLASQGFASIYPIRKDFLDDNYIAELFPDSLTSAADGWMAVIPYEDQGAHTGDINTYISLGAIDVSEISKFSVRLFQYYRKYYDMCFVDYSTDNGATWHAVEVNVTGVDMQVNTNLWGRYNYSMPNAAAAGNSTLLRIRMFSDRREHRTNAYGYWWLLDDVAIVKAKNNSLKQLDVRYWEGAYQTVPQGLTTENIDWVSDVPNTGALAQTNMQLKIDHISSTGAVTNISTSNLGNLPVDSTGSYEIQANPLNTNNIGDNYVTSTITSDSLTLAYDTIFYEVKGAEGNGTFIWGRDNGVLTAGAAYMFGYTDDGYITDESEHFVEQNYSTYVSYATGANVPENWVIRGIQYVAASSDDAFAEGASFTPTLIMDSTVEDGIILRNINLGVDPRTTNMSTDYNDSTLIVEGSGYLTSGNYNVINVELKKQPALIPNQTYRVGYRMAQNGVFAVAASATNTYTQFENDTLWRKRFDGDASTKKYASNFTLNNEQLPNYYAVYTIDPEGEDGIWGAGYYYGRYPMIRMIVGPKVEYPTHQINVTCNMEGEYGEAYFSDGSTYACGESTEVVDGLSDYIYIVPEADVQFTLTDNGTNIPISQLEPIDDGEGGVYYVYTMNNITADHNIDITYTVGIDEVASLVSMKLQPNPATSQVKLNIEGVNGMVDCALIDMCGRVVYSTKMNAETAQTINVSNLAKGAYFVRITNNDFTKVEKLVVR